MGNEQGSLASQSGGGGRGGEDGELQRRDSIRKMDSVMKAKYHGGVNINSPSSHPLLLSFELYRPQLPLPLRIHYAHLLTVCDRSRDVSDRA